MSDDNQEEELKIEEEKSASWMVTYGDMMTLLLVFFVLLFSFSSINTIEFRDLQTSLSGALSVLSGGKAVVNPEDLPNYQVKQGGPNLKAVNDFLENLRTFIQEQEMAKKAEVIMNQQGIALSVNGLALFKANSSQLTLEGQATLDKLFPLIDIFPNYIEVVGHTDLHPITRGNFADNWQLSGARALSVVKYFTAKDPNLKKRFSATAYSANKPLTTDMKKQDMNRRVNIIFKRL